MSKKRKVNSKDFEQKTMKDVEEKKLHLMEVLNDDFNDSFKESSCEELLSDFGVFPTCDPLIGENKSTTDSNNHFVSVEDLNNVNKSDLLFSDSCDYAYVLPESDLSSTVTDSNNFYNETITLYGDDNDKEIFFDDSINLLNLNNVDHTTSNPNTVNKCDLLPNCNSTEITSVTENLENIVPNLNLQQDGMTYSNGVCETNNIETPNESNCKVTAESNLLNFSEPNHVPVIDKPKVQTTHPVSEDKFSLNDFLNFKDSNAAVNNNTDNLNKYYNSLINGFMKENIQKAQARNYKMNNISSQQKLILRPNKSGFIQLPLERLKAMNNLPGIRFCVKNPQMVDSHKAFPLNSGVPLPKTRICDNINQSIDTTNNLQNATVIKLQTADKSIQTFDDIFSEPTKLVNDLQFAANRKHNNKACNGVERVLLEKIKKPELFKKKLLFTFAGNARKSLYTNLSLGNFQQDDERINYYTGIPKYSYFMALLNCLNIPNNHTISPCQMLLLTLMKIRLNLEWVDLSYRFDKSIQVVKDSFGLTVYILTRCLSRLLCWPMQEFNTELKCVRPGKNLYVYSVKLNTGNCDDQETKKRIFICLSFSGHPVHFVSKPILDKYNNKLDILEFSGIKENLVQKDVIIFDDEINYLSPNENHTSVLSVSCKERVLFCSQPFSTDIQENICKMKTVVGEIRKYKFLYENITCDWVNVPSDEYTLFSDVVKVVCGLVNLCNVLPFSNTTVQKIITERKSMPIVLA